LENDVSIKSLGDKQQHTNLISSRSLWARLRKGLESRSRFVESHLSKNLALQIRMMREESGWSQEELASKVGMNQNAISRLENPSYGKATLTTLKRLASAFDVALIVRYVPYTQLVDWVSGTPRWENGLSSKSLCVMSFAKEDSVMGQQQIRQLGEIPNDSLTRAPERGLGCVTTGAASLLVSSDRQAA
jgi:transcriptional regulator with XRE-family HTH domain